MWKADEGCQPWLGVAVQAEVAAVLQRAEGSQHDQRELLVAWGRSEANQKLICCSEPEERILGLHCGFLLSSVLCRSLELGALSLGSWRAEGG